MVLCFFSLSAIKPLKFVNRFRLHTHGLEQTRKYQLQMHISTPLTESSIRFTILDSSSHGTGNARLNYALWLF
jgi:hypothetical protein